MQLNKAQLLVGCKNLIRELQPIILAFVEAESRLVDTYDEQASEASSIGQSFANPTPELSEQYASVFRANLRIRQGLVTDTRKIALQPLFISDCRDSLRELSVRELLELAEIFASVSEGTVFDATELKVKQLVQGMGTQQFGQDFDSQYLKMLITAVSFYKRSQDILKIIEEKTKDNFTPTEEITVRELEFDRAMEGLGKYLSDIEMLESDPQSIAFLTWAAINHPSRKVPRELRDKMFDLVSWRTDYHKQRRGLQSPKEHLEADFVRYANETSTEVVQRLHAVRGQLAVYKEQCSRELKLDSKVEDFKDDFDLRRINTSKLAKIAKVYLEFAKTNLFALLVPPPGLMVSQSNINGALLRARQDSLRGIYTIESMKERKEPV